MTSEECCKKLKLNISKPYNTYYSELCFYLPYPTEDETFSSKVYLKMYEDDHFNERAIFSLTQEGKEYIEIKKNKQKSTLYNSYQAVIATIGVILAIVAIIVTILLSR